MPNLKMLPLIFAFFLHSGGSTCEELTRPKDGIESFPDLRQLHLKNEGVTLYYSADFSEILKGEHPDAKDYMEGGIYLSRPIRTQLLGPGKGFFTVDCDSGGSEDPSCAFLKEDNGKFKEVARIPGLRFVLPGNGNIYADGHNNTMFNVRRKFVWHEGAFIEIKQPFLYVGLDTTTRKAIDIYSAQDHKQVVASLPKGAALSVVLNQGEQYLVKTPFGLLGWIQIKEGMQDQSPVVGIFNAGD